MGLIVDVIIFAILAICILLGYKRGLSGSIFKIISFVLAILITFCIYKPVTNIVMEKTKVNEKLKESIISKFESKEENDEEDKEVKGILDSINEKVKDATEESKDKIVESTAEEMSDKIVTAGVTIILFLVVRVLLLVVAFIISLITEIPGIKQFDKAGGIIYGVLQGIIILYLIFAIISFFDTLDALGPLNDAIDKAYLGSILKGVFTYKIF